MDKKHTSQDEQFMSVEELSRLTGWDSMTIFEEADSGNIPGAVWGKTLRFKPEEIEAWLTPMSLSEEVEEALKALEEQGLITSYVDANGYRRYFAYNNSPYTINACSPVHEDVTCNR